MPIRTRFRLWQRGWTTVAPPTGLTWVYPFIIQRNGLLYRVDPSFNLQTYAGISVAKTYYVDRGMPDDTGDGLSWATALQKVKTAIAKVDADRVFIKTGWYEYGYGWDATSVANRNMEVIGVGGPVILSTNDPTLVYALDGNHYEAAATTKIWLVVDKSSIDANGDYMRYTIKASEAEVDSTPGSYYWAANVLYVRTFDNRAPDANILAYPTSTYCGVTTRAKTIYLEGLTFLGGAIAFGAISASALCKLYARDSYFGYCYNSNGVSITGCGEAILQRCVCAKNKVDGFKPIENTGQYANVALLDCIGRSNGVPGDTSSNGYSRHDRGQSIVVNGDYFSNYGRNIHDINAGVGNPLLWGLGVKAHDCLATGANNINFGIGTAANPGGVAWLENCISYGSTYDLDAGAGATMNYRLPFNPVKTGAGTFLVY